MCELVVCSRLLAGSRKNKTKDLRQTTKFIVRYSFIYKIMVITHGKRSFDLPPWQFSQMHSSISEGRSVLLLLNGRIAS